MEAPAVNGCSMVGLVAECERECNLISQTMFLQCSDCPYSDILRELLNITDGDVKSSIQLFANCFILECTQRSSFVWPSICQWIGHSSR